MRKYAAQRIHGRPHKELNENRLWFDGRPGHQERQDQARFDQKLDLIVPLWSTPTQHLIADMARIFGRDTAHRIKRWLVDVRQQPDRLPWPAFPRIMFPPFQDPFYDRTWLIPTLADKEMRRSQELKAVSRPRPSVDYKDLAEAEAYAHKQLRRWTDDNNGRVSLPTTLDAYELGKLMSYLVLDLGAGSHLYRRRQEAGSLVGYTAEQKRDVIAGLIAEAWPTLLPRQHTENLIHTFRESYLRDFRQRWQDAWRPRRQWLKRQASLLVPGTLTMVELRYPWVRESTGGASQSYRMLPAVVVSYDLRPRESEDTRGREDLDSVLTVRPLAHPSQVGVRRIVVGQGVGSRIVDPLVRLVLSPDTFDFEMAVATEGIEWFWRPPELYIESAGSPIPIVEPVEWRQGWSIAALSHLMQKSGGVKGRSLLPLVPKIVTLAGIPTLKASDSEQQQRRASTASPDVRLNWQAMVADAQRLSVPLAL